MWLLRFGEQGALGAAFTHPPLPLPACFAPEAATSNTRGPRRGSEPPQGKDSDESPPSFTETKTKTPIIVTSESYILQLKKGNKEPNPMVQLSIQDVTRESKVRARMPLWEVSCVGGCGKEDCSWDEVSFLESQ